MCVSKANRSRLLKLLLGIPLLLSIPALADPTDLANTPLSSGTTADVKPNVLFILDDSGSMNWRFMPDSLSAAEHRIGFRNNQCNLVYYNPTSRYVIPKTSTGSDVNGGAQTSFSAAYDDGYAAYYGLETRTSSDSGATWTSWSSTTSCTEDTSGSSRRQCRYGVLLGSAGTTSDLSSGYRAFVNGTIDSNSNNLLIDTAQPAYYWKYMGSQILVPRVGDCDKILSPRFTVNGASYASGVATLQTSAAHNFLVGQTVTVIGIQPSGYRGSFVVTAVPDSTHFKVSLASNPGGYTNSGEAWNSTEFATINEYCTDNTTTTSTCTALGKTALWRKVVVSSTSGPATADINGDGSVNASDADERQNFANWYSYYSNRMKMMKAAAGRAFLSMTDSKRIGFLTINPNSPVNAEKFLPVGPFDTTKKGDWYNLLYSQTTNGSTPLRTALSRAGRYFAHKTDGINDGMADDPVEYSCQQNFSILTTDGYWNETGGYKLDGTTDMDNQDGVISELDAYRSAGSKYTMSPRPIYDGASTTYTWNTATRTYQNTSCQRQQIKTQQTQKSEFGTWQEETTQLQKKTGQLQYRSTIEKKTGQLQSTTNLQTRTGQLQYQSKIQRKSGQLQWTTNQQKRTGQLQWTTNQQRKTGQLQWTTNQQTRTGQLQFTTTLQRMAGQLQYDSRLQRGVGQLWQNTSNDSGATWNGWTTQTTCTENFVGSNWTYCYVVVGAASWTYVTSCTQSRTGSPGSYTWTGGAATVDCQVVGTSTGWTDTSACTEIAGSVDCRINGAWSYVTTYAPSCTPTRTGSPGAYVWTGASAVDCRTEPSSTFNPTWTASTTCAESASVQCRVSPSATVAYVTTYPGTCTPTRSGSPGSYSWTGGASAVDCQTAGSFNTTWNNVANCTESAITNCQVGTGSFAYVTTYPGTCTPTRSGSPGSYAWTGGASAVDCQTAGSFNTSWNIATNCTESAITNCRVDPAGSVAYILTYPGTCTPTRSGSPGSYAWTGGTSAIDCQTAGSFNTIWTNNSVCVEGAITNCRVNASWAKAQTCTPTRTGSAGSYSWTGNASAVDCQNTGVLDGTWSSATTCTESSDVACQITAAAAWSYVTNSPATCTPTRSGSPGSYAWTGGGAAVDCQTAGSFNATWTNRSTCTEAANMQCRVNASWVQAPSCTPTRTGSAGSYAWSGNTSAIDCQSVPFGAWTNASTCNESAEVECRVNASAVGVQTCTPTRTGTAGSYAWTGNASAIDCNTVATSPYATVPYACTTSPIDSSGYTVNCQFVGGGAWTDSPTCTEDATTQCRVNDLTAWANTNICVPSTTPDATGVVTLCQNSGSSGTKLQSYATTTATTYSGPGQTGTILGSPYSTNGPLTDVVAGACYASAPSVPAAETVTGVGPPAPPDNCTSGTQTWPCETYSSGSGGLSATLSGAVWNAPGVDPTIEPATATYTTSAGHGFLVGHSVTITNANPSGYRGNFQIIEVADNTHFKVLLETNPGTYTGSGTATLYAGSSNSLADVAQYYYKTDLRNASLGNCTGSLGSSVCEDNVPSTGSGVEDDRANWQHMTTFTMGLGLTGTIAYSPNYRTDQCVAKTISGATWSSSFVTVTTSAAHGYYVNEAVTIAGGSTAGYRGQFRIYDIPSTTTFRYALATNPGAAFGTGTATACPDFNRIRSGTINWPVPVANGSTALDDLWHAAVNGRGQYFSAGDPDSVVSSLSSALAGINARVAAAAAAATSNLEPVAGDNFAYTAKYKTQAWTGDLEAREIDLTTGAVSGTVIWSAQAKLDVLTKSACDNRTIKLFRSGATNNLVNFTWNSYACDAAGAATGSPLDDLDATEKANFNAAKVALLSHYTNFGDGTGITVDQRTPAAGANLVNFLRGQRGKEGFSSNLPITNTDVNKLYRTREHVLGDIINAQPVFVRGPFAEYDDTGYAAFKNGTAASRTPMVYSAANDGMLHAFHAGTSIVDTNGGVESWAFIPTMVLPNLYKLASESYSAGHAYSVDGTPSVGDVYQTSAAAAAATTSALAAANAAMAAAAAAKDAAYLANAAATAAADGTPASAAAATAAATAATAAAATATSAAASATAAAVSAPTAIATATVATATAATAGAAAATAGATAANAAAVDPTAPATLTAMAATTTAIATAQSSISTATVDLAAAPSAAAVPNWKTILVAGLNKGGRGYYALDITDPATPKALWEFKHDAGNCVTVDATTKAPATDEYTDCHIGYSFNNPVISKLRDGRWVVFVTSGYNNVNTPSATGDGIGYLYVLEALTGKILYKIATGVGDATTPSGLNHISAWVEGSSTKNNQTERVYGVDLAGNVWRFDVNDILNATGREATRIATLVDGSGVPQPITTRPELATVNSEAVVYVGTGRYLGTSDLADTQTQTIWALRDSLSATALTNLRSNLRRMTITNHGSGSSAFRTNGCTSGCSSVDGWFADLPDTGERVNIDMKLQLGTLVVASNVPETNACNIGGYAWLNYFNNSTGEAVTTSADHAVGRRLVGTGGQESLAVGLNIVRLPSGKTVVIATTSAAQQVTVEAPFDVAPPTGKRVSWREIVQ